MLEQRLGYPMTVRYEEQNRLGDHICYMTDLRKLKRDYPNWQITRTLNSILYEILDTELSNGATADPGRLTGRMES